MDSIPVHALWLAQDDPKKNTAVLASKRGDLTLHKNVRSLPKRGVILEPLCGKVFGPEDHELLTQREVLSSVLIAVGRTSRPRSNR